MDGEVGDGLSNDRTDHVDEHRHAASITDICFFKIPTSTEYVVEKYLVGKTPITYLTGIGAVLDFKNSQYCCIVIVLSGKVTIKSHHDGARDLAKKTSALFSPVPFRWSRPALLKSISHESPKI
jgi:hypothetical protein